MDNRLMKITAGAAAVVAIALGGVAIGRTGSGDPAAANGGFRGAPPNGAEGRGFGPPPGGAPPQGTAPPANSQFS